jgi:hypothetical protein
MAANSKEYLPPVHVIKAASMASNITQVLPIYIQLLDNVAVQLNWTGTPTGTFQISGSLDHTQDSQGNITNAGTFIPITLSPSPAASGSASNILINLSGLSFPYIQVAYTATGGTGTLDAYIGAKAI